MSQDTQAGLRRVLPEEAAAVNPVDAIASASPEQYEKALSLILEDPGIDAAIALYIPPLVTRPQEIAEAIGRAQARGPSDKPLLACFMTSEEVADIGSPSGRRVPVFAFPEDAVQALARSYQYARYWDEEGGRIPKRLDVNLERARKLLRSAVAGSEGLARLCPEAGMALLREYGIPAVETRVAYSVEEAAEQAKGLGFPVAMKVRSTTIVHKTDVGGVALDLGSASAVGDAFRAMTRRLQEAGLGPAMEGVVLQPMVRGGQEMILGMTSDPVVGPLIMVGVGGIHVELFKDIAFALHPLTDLDPERMLGRLKGLPLLQGWRGSPPRDIEALKDMLLRFSALIEDLDEIVEMEINPLVVRDRGLGCIALDARIAVKGR